MLGEGLGELLLRSLRRNMSSHWKREYKMDPMLMGRAGMAHLGNVTGRYIIKIDTRYHRDDLPLACTALETSYVD